MAEIEKSNVSKIFDELDQALQELDPGKQRVIIIFGGAALISLGLISRSTMDIDVLDPEIDSVTKSASEKVGKKFGLRSDWVNNGPRDLLRILPSDWNSRITSVYTGNALTVYSIGRKELIISNLFAEADVRKIKATF